MLKTAHKYITEARQEMLNENKYSRDVDQVPNDRVQEVVKYGDIGKATKFILNKPDRKTFQISGDNNSRLIFEVRSVFKAISEMEITKVEVLLDLPVYSYEYMSIKGKSRNYFDIQNPEGDVLFRIHFKNAVRQS